MSKDKLPKDILAEVAHSRPTVTPQKTHREDTKGTQRDNMKIYKLRFQGEDWEALKQHFEGKGIKVSQGIRMIIKEYMEKEGI